MTFMHSREMTCVHTQKYSGVKFRQVCAQVVPLASKPHRFFQLFSTQSPFFAFFQLVYQKRSQTRFRLFQLVFRCSCAPPERSSLKVRSYRRGFGVPWVSLGRPLGGPLAFLWRSLCLVQRFLALRPRFCIDVLMCSGKRDRIAEERAVLVCRLVGGYGPTAAPTSTPAPGPTNHETRNISRDAKRGVQ